MGTTPYELSSTSYGPATATVRKTDPRSSGARSRNGCNTCKIRRVKCDETKPGCFRCAKFGRPCDGYTIKKKSQPSNVHRVKQDQRTRAYVPIAVLPLTKVTPCSPRLPMRILFSDQQEERYFRVFHEETAGTLAGGFDSPLWNRIVLQACHDEPCILHCAVAISALDKACKQSPPRRPKKISQHPDSLRTILIACLLIWCFENFHGDIRLSLTNVQSSVDLLHKWLAENTRTSTPKGFSSRPSVIENELVLAFARLDVHLTSWMDLPPSRTSILAYAVTEPSPIPLQFSSLTEARNCFDHVVNRVFAYLGRIRSIKNEIDASLENHVYDENGKPFIEPPEAIELRKWLQAYAFTLKTARLPAYGQDFVGALTLQMHGLAMDISLRQAFFETGIMDLGERNVYDVFLPEYRELVALAREVSEHPHFVKSFIFDSGIVPCLFIVVTKCRDPMVRRDAIEVMKRSTPRREGVWDAHMVARIGDELLTFDREEEVAMSVEERKKIWVSIHLTCLSTTFMLPAPPGEHDGAVREGRQYLLGWMERSMKMDIVSEEPRYGIPELPCSLGK